MTPKVAGSIAPESPAQITESLSAVEQRLLVMAKNEADRRLQEELAAIIRAHGHDPADGRAYNFVHTDEGTLALLIG